MRGGSSTVRWSGWGWARSRSWSRSPATTATCCSTSSPAGIRCLGIEPSVNVGEAARGKGVPTLTAFLTPGDRRAGAGRARAGAAGRAEQRLRATSRTSSGSPQGLRALVADDGWVSIEVQHLLTLVERTQFDTIYHEHFQYYTVLTAQRALASGGLALVDVELLDTHGGSVRLWARPVEVAGEPSAGRPRRAGRGAGGRAAHGGGARRVRRAPCRGCGTTWSRS